MYFTCQSPFGPGPLFCTSNHICSGIVSNLKTPQLPSTHAFQVLKIPSLTGSKWFISYTSSLTATWKYKHLHFFFFLIELQSGIWFSCSPFPYFAKRTLDLPFLLFIARGFSCTLLLDQLQVHVPF